LTLLDNARAY
jgi:hypothetical protein